MLPFIDKFVTRKDCRDVARMHAESEATTARIEALMNSEHRRRTGHAYELVEGLEDCATCSRDNSVANQVEEAAERLRRCARGACLSADCHYDPETRLVVCSVCGKGERLCMHPEGSHCTTCKPETALPRAKSVQIRRV